MSSAPLTIERLARRQHAKAIQDPKELIADIWASDEDIEAFLMDVRSSRDASMG